MFCRHQHFGGVSARRELRPDQDAARILIFSWYYCYISLRADLTRSTFVQVHNCPINLATTLSAVQIAAQALGVALYWRHCGVIHLAKVNDMALKGRWESMIPEEPSHLLLIDSLAQSFIDIWL